MDSQGVLQTSPRSNYGYFNVVEVVASSSQSEEGATTEHSQADVSHRRMFETETPSVLTESYIGLAFELPDYHRSVMDPSLLRYHAFPMSP